MQETNQSPDNAVTRVRIPDILMHRVDQHANCLFGVSNGEHLPQLS